MNVDDNIDEMDGMNQILARYANIPYDSIKVSDPILILHN